MLFLKADKWELCKNGAVVAAVRNKSKTLVSRMEALASSSGKEWLHGEVSFNHTVGKKWLVLNNLYELGTTYLQVFFLLDVMFRTCSFICLCLFCRVTSFDTFMRFFNFTPEPRIH